MKRINYEEQKSRFFTKYKERYPHMLYRYKHYEEFFPEDSFKASTAGDGESHAFTDYLKAYIREFSPMRLCKSKNYYIELGTDGDFGVYKENGKKAKLSKSEKTIFQYLCYLCMAKFWQGFEKMRDLHYEPKPLVIKDFSKDINSEEDYDELINEARNLDCGIILLK